MNTQTTFKTNRDTSTALVKVDFMLPREALSMHIKVRDKGRGAVKAFVENDTVYDNYPQYYHALKKKGVAPFKPQGPKAAKAAGDDLELRVQHLEKQMSTVEITPAKRAVDLLHSNMDYISYSSRKFLCSLIQRDYKSLSPKQEKWLSNLEDDFS